MSFTSDHQYNFAAARADGRAVWLDTNGDILVLAKPNAINLPDEVFAEVTSPEALRRLLISQINHSNHVRILEALDLLISNQYSIPLLERAVDDLANGLGSKIVAYKFADERAAPEPLGTPLGAGSNFTAPADLEAGQNVSEMPIEDRLMLAIQNSPGYMDDAAAAEFKNLLAPATIAIMVASLIALAAIAVTGVGGVIVLAVGWAMVGWAIFDAAGHFIDFFTLVNNAKSKEDLDRAAEMFARAVVALGVGALLNFLTKGASRAASKGGEKVREAVDDAVERANKRTKQSSPGQKGENRQPVTNPTASQVAAAEKYGVDPKWVKANGKIDWPSNQGFAGTPKNTTLQPGTKIDRYGSAKDGEYLAPTGTSFEQRALPASSKSREYHQYEVVKPLPVQSGKTASWFGQSGGGIQYKLKDGYDVQRLIKDGYLKEIK